MHTLQQRLGTGSQRFRLRKSPPETRGLSLRPFAASSVAQRGNYGSQYFQQDTRPIILFDGVCNLCNGGVNTALRFDPDGALRFAALQSGAGKTLLQRSGRSPNDISSIVLVDQGESYIKSEAILRIAKYLQNPFPFLALMGFPVPLFLRDSLYDTVMEGVEEIIIKRALLRAFSLQIANSRYSIFGQSTVCRMKDEDKLNRFLE